VFYSLFISIESTFQTHRSFFTNKILEKQYKFFSFLLALGFQLRLS